MRDRLEILAKIHYGKSPNEVISIDGNFPIVGTGGIYGRADRAMFESGIVVARKGSLGNPQLFKAPFWPVDTTYAVIPCNDIDIDWLYYCLLNFDLTKLNEATGVPSINRSWLAKTSFANPGTAKQRKIAVILTSIDAAIQKTEALIGKYQHIKAGLMHDLFTRGVLPNGQLRPLRDVAPELYQETATGWIPSEWEAKTLRTACDWYSGGTPSKQNEEWWKGSLPWLSPKDMKRFELADTEDHVTRQAALSGSRLAPKGTVFIVVRGMILAHSFPVVVNGNEFAFNQDIKAVIGRAPLNNRYLAYWFVANTDLLLKKTTESTHGTKRFDLNDLYKINIGIPSELEQQRMISRLDVIEQRIEKEITQREKLKIQKLGLMQDLLTGKVPVRVDEPEAADA